MEMDLLTHKLSGCFDFIHSTFRTSCVFWFKSLSIIEQTLPADEGCVIRLKALEKGFYQIKSILSNNCIFN